MEKFSNAIQELPDGAHALRLFTDGSCHYTHRVGGWAFILQSREGLVLSSSGAVADTTSSRMELFAAVKGLEQVPEGFVVELVTDSEYLGKGIALWMHVWSKNGFKLKNGDLWQQLFNLCQSRSVYVSCIKGHCGQPENEECDRMAGEASAKMRGLNV